MNLFIIGFCSLLISAILWPSIPSVVLCPLYLIGILVIFKRSKLLTGAICSALYLSLFVFGQSSDLSQLKNDRQTNDGNVMLSGKIVSFIEQQGEWASVDIKLIQPKLPLAPSAYVRLNWSNPPKLALGQVWALNIKLKPITSLVNQGGYNQQKNLLSKHIIAKGKVLQAELIFQRQSLRTFAVETLRPVAESITGGDIFLALTLGDKSLIDAETWKQLRETGLGHLVAISGLHLSVVATWVYFLILMCLKHCCPTQSRRNLIIALCLSACSATLYAYFAGFALATQRALIMIVILLLLSLFKRYASVWERLLYALFGVLVFDPVAFLSAGFWLSFVALVIILLSINETSDNKKCLIQFVLLQFKLTIGLGLVQQLLFGGFGLHSFWLNLLMVPWFSFIVIPLSLGVMCLWMVGQIINIDLAAVFIVFEWAIQAFYWVMDLSSSMSVRWVSFSVVIQSFIFAIVVAFIGYRLFPYKPWRWLVLLPIMPFLLYWVASDSRIWRLHLLDVGQGLATVIEQNGRAIIYDTGAAYGNDFSYAQRVIIPFLEYRGLDNIDYIFVSHGDNDHAGGIKVLTKRYPKAMVISDAVAAHQTCRPKIITWQHVTIKILAPIKAMNGNNGSCVVKVYDQFNSVLFTGDIEKQAEHDLIKQYRHDVSVLKSKVLIAPHHGSRTSSSEGFINAVSPKITLFAAGFNNHYGFPKANVLERYHRLGSELNVTGDLGQISLIFKPKGLQINSYREDFAPFWYNSISPLQSPN